MKKIKYNLQYKQKGISITEYMVGMAIGLFSVLVISKTFVDFGLEKNKNIDNADSQNIALISSYLLERDLKNAGFSLTSNQIPSCSNFYGYYNTAPINNFTLDSIKIDSGVGSNGSDDITIQYGTANASFGGTEMRSGMSTPSSTINVNSVVGCKANDLVILSDGNNCSLIQATGVSNTTLQITQNTSTYNPSASYKNAQGWPTYAQGSKMTCIGSLISNTYGIDNNNLVKTEFPTNASTTLFENIVLLKAQYGISSSASSKDITSWVNPTGTWATLDNTERTRIRAIKYAIVARSRDYEKDIVTNSCTNNSGNINKGPCLWPDDSTNPAPTIDLSGDGNWQHYRYQVISKVIPLKNIIWS